jgi:hypothetical protein
MFCMQAHRRAERLLHQLWANDDQSQYGFAQRLLEGRYLFFESDVFDPAGEGPMIPRSTHFAAGARS